jgi:hypothetical protein
MTWWLVPAGLLAGGFLWLLLRRMLFEDDIATKHVKEAHARAAFSITCAEREILEEDLKRQPYPPPPMKPGESPWDWTRRAADAGYIKLKPWEPPWGYLRMREETKNGVDITISVKLWTTNIEGVLHRVGRLPVVSGSSTPVLLCDTTTRVTTPIVEYDRERCPLITCLRCIVNIKD